MILNHAITDFQSVASKWIPRELKNSFYVQECKYDENSEADDAQQSDLLENDEFPGGDKKQQTHYGLYTNCEVFFQQEIGQMMSKFSNTLRSNKVRIDT